MTIKDFCELLKGKEDYQVILRGDNSEGYFEVTENNIEIHDDIKEIWIYE